MTVTVEHERSRRAPERKPGRAPRELLEPAKALGPRHGRVRRRSRRKHEQPRVAEPALPNAEVRALAERAPVCLLADEADPAGSQVVREALEPLGRTREVSAAEIARARSRPEGGVRDPDALPEDVVLLVRLVEARREAGRVEEPPEVVARIREVGSRRGRDATRVDAAEDDAQPGRENVRDGRGQAASGSRASSRRSNRIRRSSPEMCSKATRG